MFFLFLFLDVALLDGCQELLLLGEQVLHGGEHLLQLLDLGVIGVGDVSHLGGELVCGLLQVLPGVDQNLDLCRARERVKRESQGLTGQRYWISYYCYYHDYYCCCYSFCCHCHFHFQYL